MLKIEAVLPFESSVISTRLRTWRHIPIYQYLQYLIRSLFILFKSGLLIANNFAYINAAYLRHERTVTSKHVPAITQL
jgi:hypothetical protein